MLFQAFKQVIKLSSRKSPADGIPFLHMLPLNSIMAFISMIIYDYDLYLVIYIYTYYIIYII